MKPRRLAILILDSLDLGLNFFYNLNIIYDIIAKDDAKFQQLSCAHFSVVIHLITEEGYRDISFFHFYFFGGNWRQLSCTFARYVFPFWNE